MNKIKQHAARDYGYGLIGSPFMPPTEQELAMREVLQLKLREYRPLTSSEIDQLRTQGNQCADWGSVMVSERFNPKLIQNCTLCGLVRLGNLESLVLDFASQRLAVGLYNSTIVSCDLGDNVAIHRVDYLAHYILGESVILHSIGRMMTTPQAHFGHGILKDGEDPAQRAWIAVGNENGGRSILPFVGMRTADAWLWAKHRQRPALLDKLIRLTDERFDSKPGYYGTVGDRTIIMGVDTIVDAAIGSDALIEGAGKLVDLTICSDAQEPSRVGHGVGLAHGIVGYGARIDSGARVEHFVLGTNVALDMGARVMHTFLGDNSHVACCEVLNTLVFPNHQQHHNNSFLIAGVLQGQSNIAAGSTIGSNHNSRSLDGEFVAGRGFWPGLCSSFKHHCRLASFALVAKGDYPAEMRVPLPFCLVSQGADESCLQLMPGYWFLYNMYALARNDWKFQNRDRRVHDAQHIEHRALAPDTVEEMLAALELLEQWVGQAELTQLGQNPKDVEPEELRRLGRELIEKDPAAVDRMRVEASGVEQAGRPVFVLKAGAAWHVYREMINFYAVERLVDLMLVRKVARPWDLEDELSGPRQTRWENLGGQIVSDDDVQALLAGIESGQIGSWKAVHARYDQLWEDYPAACGRHAYACLLALHGAQRLEADGWQAMVDAAVATRHKMAALVRASRAKDYEHPIRRACFDSVQEMEVVVGRLEDDPFIAQMQEAASKFEQKITDLTEQTGVLEPPAGE